MRSGAHERGSGMTLVEIMLVVAIIGLLGATSIPSYTRYQLRAKTSEAKVNLQAIRIAEMSYLSVAGRFVGATASPATYSGVQPGDFADTGTPTASFGTMGWRPEGRVYFSYAVTVGGGGTQFTADAAGDLDGDGAPQIWGLVHPDPVGGIVPGARGCVGVLDPATGLVDRFSSVGPCGIEFGSSVF